MSNKLIVLLVFLGIVIFGGIITRVMFFTYVDRHELGYEYNKRTGIITPLERTGYFGVTPTKTVIYTIDMRPHQIRVEANKRVLNAKLVKFRKEGLLQFIDAHGLGDYEYSDMSGGNDLGEILKSYAYEDEVFSKEKLEQKYKFIEIVDGTNMKDSTLKK